VVITGLGIKSSIGTDKQEVVDSLFHGRGGVEFCSEYAELGFRTHVYAPVQLDLDDLIDRKQRRFMGDAAAYTYLAMQDALEDAGLDPAAISDPRIGLIAGSGGIHLYTPVRSRTSAWPTPKACALTNT